MNRQPFQQRTFRLVGIEQRDRLLALVGNLPLDAVKPLEVVIREEKKKRTLDQNALYWSGPLADIAEQAWAYGRQYCDKAWHDEFRKLYLPDDKRPGFDQTHVKDGYEKWIIGVSGEPVLIGSTTELTVKGMSVYLEQVYAHGANLGVQFSERGHDL